jgi:hypothetical protein
MGVIGDLPGKERPGRINGFWTPYNWLGFQHASRLESHKNPDDVVVAVRGMANG